MTLAGAVAVGDAVVAGVGVAVAAVGVAEAARNLAPRVT